MESRDKWTRGKKFATRLHKHILEDGIDYRMSAFEDFDYIK